MPILVSFLDDPDIDYKITWAMRNIGGKSAIEELTRWRIEVLYTTEIGPLSADSNP